MQLEYKNPRKVRGGFVFKANTKFLSNQDMKTELDTDLKDPKLLQKLVEKYGNKLYLESGYENKNKFFVWFSRIKNWDNQKNVKVKYQLKPNDSYIDRENDNIIDFFDFSDKLNKRFHLKINFSFESYETKIEITNKIKEFNKGSFLYKRYTESERYLEQTKEVKKLAKDIAGREKNYFKRAKKIFHWVLDNLTYKYPPEKRGVIPTLKNRNGDCGEFNFVFISLCRSLGIPARSVTGMWASPKLKQGFHAWAEFYLEGVGWIPVDSSVAQALKVKERNFIKFTKNLNNPINPDYYFGNLDNKRLIFSKGNNILLKNFPIKLSKLFGMEKGRALFMQPSYFPFVGGKRKGIFVIDINQELIV